MRLPITARLCLRAVLFTIVALEESAAQTRNLSEHEITQKLNQYLKRANASGLFSGAVTVGRGGKTLFHRGFGSASIAYDVPNSPDTRFDIGSVSKTFTAAAILKLQDQGKLRVDDGICQYLSDCPAAWRPITIRHLLSHTSGIPNYTELPDQFEMRALASFIPDAMKRIRAMQLQFVPGDRFSYSNTGYKLLAEIVAQASGRRYEDMLRSEILEPLHLNNTGFLESPGVRHLIVRNLATGYTDGVGPLELAPWVHPSYGGGLYSTAPDMCAWGAALLRGDVLSPRALTEAFTAVKGNYGYGWFIYGNATHPFVMHAGNIPGFGATFAIYPDDSIVVFVVSNLDTAPTARIEDDVARIVFGEPYQPLPNWQEIGVDPKRYDDYVGRYRKTDDAKFVISIKSENGRLWNRLSDEPGAADMVLRPLGTDRFFNKMFVLYEVTFERDRQGRVTSLLAAGPWGSGTFLRVE